MKNARRWSLRFAGVGVLMLALTGPAPGRVGGCGASTQGVSASAHCSDKEFWFCRRDQFAGRIDDEQFSTCLSQIATTCSGIAWPVGCEPTPGQSEACILLLQRGDLATLTNDQLLSMYTDCNLCR